EIQGLLCVKRSRESIRLSCKGSEFDFDNIGMHWVRQAPGKGLPWIAVIWFDASKQLYAESVKGRFTISRDNANYTAVYYCTAYTARGSESGDLQKLPLSATVKYSVFRIAISPPTDL
uniref:Ig-like domain-containing protein n=1 Tax=Pseudonaja textilis TaxID=8673 RepID=A0A670ZHH7_PSETE